jgi:hypothetical protein
MPRFMMLLKTSETQADVPDSLYHAIGEAAKAWLEDGILLDTGGLVPTAASARVRLADSQITTVSGPFSDGDQAVTAYAILQADSQDDAIKLGSEFLGLHQEHMPDWHGACEIRQIFGGTGG